MCRKAVFGLVYSFILYDPYRINIISSPAASSAGTLDITVVY